MDDLAPELLLLLLLQSLFPALCVTSCTRITDGARKPASKSIGRDAGYEFDLVVTIGVGVGQYHLTLVSKYVALIMWSKF